MAEEYTINLTDENNIFDQEIEVNPEEYDWDRINKSEVINQKKQFIFKVSQSTNYIFPNEIFTYYIYIKNISGSTIESFKIKIKNSPGIVFSEDDKPSQEITLKPNEVKLYEMKAFCPLKGKYFVHFIGLGNGTQVAYQTLSIKCTRSYNSDKMMHRIHIYDFTPYEDKYSMEADNYSDQVTQIFKKQKLPYKAGEQPFPTQKDFIPENIESQSFLDQYEEAKNTKEHVYQYISRENFTEDSTESFTGENLIELFDKINKESDYFNARFLRTGTNHLLNDFTQYAPNGFIHRMGLLNSEIYHYLGVLPTYSYMSDRLFRWAPSKNQPLNLIPEKKAMKWSENIWAGRGWFVYRNTTEEYEQTEEFAKKVEDKTIIRREFIGGYEDKRLAEEVVHVLENWDDVERTNTQSTLVKYEYTIEESIYDTGVFFINIPINKIPKNFYLLDNDSLYSIINRVRPFGTKPIINYIIEETFNHHIDQSLDLNYHKNFLFESNPPMIEGPNNYLKEFGIKEINCEGQESYTYPSIITKHASFSKNFTEQEMTIEEMDCSNINIQKLIEMNMGQKNDYYQTKTDNQIITLDDVVNVLYQGNYDSISFRIPSHSYNSLNLGKEEDASFIERYEDVIINSKIVNGIKLHVPKQPNYKEEFSITIEDTINKKYKINFKYDEDMDMEFIKYTYINRNNQEFIRKRGYQNIESIVVLIKKLYNKKMLLFMVEDSTGSYHYFHHVIVQGLSKVNAKKILNDEEKPFTQNLYYTGEKLSMDIIFETPFVKESLVFQPKFIRGGENWINLYRLNEKETSYSYIKNMSNEFLLPSNIYLDYDQINIPDTSIIDKIRLKIIGSNTEKNNTYISHSFNTNYLLEQNNGNIIQLSPNSLECYSRFNEGSTYYKNKLETAINKGQDNFVKLYQNLLEKNILFTEDVGNSIKSFETPNDFITISQEYWCELFDFTDLTYKLNEISSINLIIEGYNTDYETEISAQTLSETEQSSVVKSIIPSGYFRKKIDLLYPAQFLLELLRVRFKFNSLNHDIKIFNATIEVEFKNKQLNDIFYENIQKIDLNKKQTITLLENYYKPYDINNGTGLELSFDEMSPGQYYHLNKTELEIIFTNTDMNIMVTGNRYKDIFHGILKSGIYGIVDKESYLSGLFYNDVPTMMQEDDNVGYENRGIKLTDTLYQSFEARDDNITSIEIFPYGFKGNPDDILKIGLYTNANNTPDKLIKEVLVGGWVKNNEELKKLDRIKYNINIENLEINRKYWFKIQILNPQENSYYLLKGINDTKPGFKLLANEKNNYINTFSNLKFNIYSKNLSLSFNNLPVFQERFDNPYAIIGLHKGLGSVKKLQTNKYVKNISGFDYMSEVFKSEVNTELFKIIENKNNVERELPTEEEE